MKVLDSSKLSPIISGPSAWPTVARDGEQAW
jgi:hypothetical protein